MREVNEVEVATENRLDEVQISSTTLMRKEKAQQENVEEAIQEQGTINLKPDAIILKRLATVLQNLDSPSIELRRRLTMWSKKKRA